MIYFTKNNVSVGRSVSTVSLASCIHPRDNLGPRWWLRGTIHKKIAEEIITLIKEMTEVNIIFYYTIIIIPKKIYKRFNLYLKNLKSTEVFMNYPWSNFHMRISF